MLAFIATVHAIHHHLPPPSLCLSHVSSQNPVCVPQKAGLPLETAPVLDGGSGLPASPAAWGEDEGEAGAPPPAAVVRVRCLALLHTLRVSARELVPLELLEASADEAKVRRATSELAN